MNVVNISFDGSNFTVLLIGNLQNYFFDSIADFGYQNTSTVFYAPYQVIVQCVFAMRRITRKLFHNIGLLYHKTCAFVTLKRRLKARLSGKRFIHRLKDSGLLAWLVKSEIQWTEATWNPWHGCTKVSDGCRFCYMYRDKERYGQNPTTVLRSKSTFNQPLKMKEPTLIFTCSWSDWFIKEADEWRGEAWKIIKDTPHHIYQILTKRPENILDRLPDDWGSGYGNVWLGVSIESNKTKWRLDHLRKVRAAIKFVSFEPLLESVSDADLSGIDWAIFGGESGNENGKYQYRPCEIDWIREGVWNCRRYNVAPFVKQFGTYLAKKMKLKDNHGGDISEFPEDLRIREMPKLTN